ncbi:hypothetical protein FHE72_09080 [Rossellomorea vietnamensis]|jgi:hypothetical protein|uniref:DUF1440 domain-containing protein n=1 Tax=Rossellomorea vietnamensis TaxID=218284 RepID=A0A6I6UPJ8_9BACI|nr:hypothetical protein FHE72_09080 [Rossellomorea vietnamensis]
MTFKQIGFAVGIISGTILGLFLKWIQGLTGIKVYVLLLNVDFIPVFASTLPEWLEFSLHLLVSCGIGLVFVFLMEKLNVSSRGAWILSLLLTFPTVFLYFPLSYLAVQDVPGLFDEMAITFWTIGHLLYGLSLPPLYQFFTKANHK